MPRRIGVALAFAATLYSLAASAVVAQEVRTFDPRGLVVGVGFGTATFSGDLGSAFDEANSSFRFEAYYNLSERFSLGLNFLSSKYGLRDTDSRGSLGVAARFRIVEDRVSPYLSGGYHILNGGEKTGSGPTAGLGIEWATSDRFSLFLEGLWQGSRPDDAFEGRIGGSSLDQLITVGIGARVRLTQPKRPRFSISIVAPDTVLVGDVVNLRAMVDGDPSSPVFLSWKIEQFTEYRGDEVRHTFRYLGPQRAVLIARNKRYEVRQVKEIVVVDDPIYEQKDNALPATPTNVAGQVRILEIYGDRQIKTGEAHNYRVRLRAGATWPVNYHWDMGDGTVLIGNNVLHAYRAPGSYTIVANARNPLNSDTLSTEVIVAEATRTLASRPQQTAPRNETTVPASENVRERPLRYHPEELRSRDGIEVSEGGYGWSVGNYMDRQSAERRMRQFKVRGFRSDILVDSQGGGSSVFRVVVGQFATSTSALAAKREVQRLNDIPVSLLEIGTPSQRSTPVEVAQTPEPPPTQMADDNTPPLVTRPVVRYIGPQNATTLDVSKLGASDPESNISTIDYRITSSDGDQVWTDWTTIATPNAPSAETSTIIELPLFKEDQRVVLEVRATNGRGLSAVSSVAVYVDVDETPPVFGSTQITVGRMGNEAVLDMELGVTDVESGIAQTRYRILDRTNGQIYANWTDVTGRSRELRTLSEIGLSGPRSVVVEIEAQNGAGSVNSYAKGVDIPSIEAMATAPHISAALDAPVPAGSADETDVRVVPNVPGPAIKSMKVYIREDRLLLFLDGIADASSTIQRVDYRVLSPAGTAITGWSPIYLVPPGKKSYGLQMHRLPIPLGASSDSRVEVRIINGEGGRTIIAETVGDNS